MRAMPLTIRAALWGVCFACLIAVSGGAQVQDLPAATESYGGFGLPDQSGTRFIVMPGQDRNVVQPVNLTLLKSALCSGGSRVPVQFEGRQITSANDGRAT